jgi:hypothetical protein
MYANAWSAASEALTGITRAMLDQDGLPPSTALKQLLDAVGDRDLFSDEPEFDDHWLGMAVDAAAVTLGGRKLGDARKLLEQIGLVLEPGKPPRHRAEADARRVALAFARLVSPV